MDSFTDLHVDDDASWQSRPDGVVLEGIVGSRAYGLASEGSDADRRGVFLAPSEQFFGLDDVQETADNPNSDEVLWELARCIRQALKVNPTMTELLWLDDYEICMPVGRELIGLRTALLSAARVRSSYLNAAAGLYAEARRGGPRTAKTARHMARLLITGYGLWYSGQLTVQLADPEFVHDFGERVALGDLGRAEDLIAKYEQMFGKTVTPLPAEPQRERVDTWLKATRAAALAVQAN